MGYRVDTSAPLDLEGMVGAEVVAKIGVPLSALREYDSTDTREEEFACFLRVAEPTWNLEDDDGLIPVDGTALDRLPDPVSRLILRSWRLAAAKPPAPLPPPSSDGEQ
jgi:hypothetical protein